ncbi:MAG: helicase [Chrysiogenetes bacterium]|nr:helicase [Chrysiogenetes bacterium]
MPRLLTFRISIKTGETGHKGPVVCRFNDHVMPLEAVQGGTGPGETYSGEFSPMSFVHGFVLEGPAEGSWDIERIDMDYDLGADGSHQVALGPVTLDEKTSVNIWKDRPLPTWDV